VKKRRRGRDHRGGCHVVLPLQQILYRELSYPYPLSASWCHGGDVHALTSIGYWLLIRLLHTVSLLSRVLSNPILASSYSHAFERVGSLEVSWCTFEGLAGLDRTRLCSVEAVLHKRQKWWCEWPNADHSQPMSSHMFTCILSIHLCF
jgi:hypothetical protein